MKKSIFAKPHASLDEQVKLLEERGLAINNKKMAMHHLSIIGYYRLSTYGYRFETPPQNQCRSHRFLPGTTFDDIIRVYVFDQKLKLLVLEALERFEIAARTIWTYEMSKKLGSHPHTESANFKDQTEYHKSLDKLQKEAKSASKHSEEVAHYYKHYSAPSIPPIWIVTSIMTFRELFKWIENTQSTTIKQNVAKRLGFPNIKTMLGTARSLTTVRNICAHHGRLWDRRFTTKLPYIKKNLSIPLSAISDINGNPSVDPRMYNCIATLGNIMLFLNNSSSWTKRIGALINENLTEKEQKTMGFPDGWKYESRWGINTPNN